MQRGLVGSEMCIRDSPTLLDQLCYRATSTLAQLISLSDLATLALNLLQLLPLVPEHILFPQNSDNILPNILKTLKQLNYVVLVASPQPNDMKLILSLIHISEPTRPLYISYAVFCLKKKKKYRSR
eukprot:TRINITY_DN2673_c0_g1_i12.p2 TRINITY_DN2673_c0_g1~~TRINITY_DN2673_c0_g1_i12.p2  ORF type:complete len:126 (+),score=25.68 TRINITY_DN2673_c0_g1_i12:165-542(+)